MYYYLVYVSSATVPFSTQDLADLLVVSRNNNSKLDITGILLYKEGNFLQLLEGDEKEVKKLYDKIEMDVRHGGAIVLTDGFEDVRQFPDWSMGFRNFNDPEVQALPGYNHFMNTQFTKEEFAEKPQEIRDLLNMFKEQLR